MHVFAAPFKGTAPNASVLLGVELRGRDLKLDAERQARSSRTSRSTRNGKVTGGNTDSLTLNLQPETKARVEQTGLRMLNRLDLPPGRYQLRVAAHDPAGGNVGSVLYDLEVPDFYKAPFSMSGLVLTSAAGAAMPTVAARRAAEGGAAGAADRAARRFRRTTSSRCSPRSTTTPARRRTRWTSPRR